MTAIKEALTRFYGVTPKIQCLPPEEVKTPNTHSLPKPKNQPKPQTNKRLTTSFFFFFFKVRLLLKKQNKTRVKNLQRGET